MPKIVALMDQLRDVNRAKAGIDAFGAGHNNSSGSASQTAKVTDLTNQLVFYWFDQNGDGALDSKEFEDAMMYLARENGKRIDRATILENIRKKAEMSDDGYFSLRDFKGVQTVQSFQLYH